MKRSRIAEVAAQAGMNVASDDDPRYREGVSIMLKGQSIRKAPAPAAAEAEHEAEASDDAGAELCPYCGNETCPHHAASLDLTFRQVVGGELYDAVNACLERIITALTDSDEDTDVEAEAFERLGEVLEALPGVLSIDSEWHGGPGQSSVMRHYWVEDAATMVNLTTHLGAIDC